ncbi:protein late bloomer-like [Teleopsis dalmanni]|uniref:protein late bloomer-like n=1 Tax=Teleopsis dalmanni TaxID=139649 RepID=UPI0018CC9E16|nr:protein late bloomer-like [Teleopsis dalmanni]XP_037954423.1 protein late bloomer-like [Teleopsis dalmanni]
MVCSTYTLKFISFILNILCCMFGAMMLSANAYAIVAWNDSNAIKVPCIIGITVGSLLFLTTIFGCWGAVRQSDRMTWCYTIIMFLLMAAQICAIFLQPVDFNKLANETITYVWNQQLINNSTMTQYEIKYNCCGKNGPNDYIQSGLPLPPACYIGGNSTAPTLLYSTGCIQVVSEAYANSSEIETISDWILVGLVGITIIFSGMLAISFKNNKRRQLYR